MRRSIAIAFLALLAACSKSSSTTGPTQGSTLSFFVTSAKSTTGNIGGFVAPIVMGVAVDRWHSWSGPFYITALIYAGGAVAWLVIDPARPLTRQST